MTIRILPVSDEHLPGFHAALDTVARERKYIALTAAFPLPGTIAFIHQMLAAGGLQFVALTPTDDVIGWCDIERQQLEGFRHVGRLGMGLLKEYRGQGIGRLLALSAIAEARAKGMERIELEVFASNIAAIRLYERLGFGHEGVKVRSRKLDDGYDDIVGMALLGEPRGG